jgi:hypothetical protein
MLEMVFRRNEFRMKHTMMGEGEGDGHACVWGRGAGVAYLLFNIIFYLSSYVQYVVPVNLEDQLREFAIHNVPRSTFVTSPCSRIELVVVVYCIDRMFY